MQVELRERTFGELIGQTYSLAAKHFVKLFLIGLVIGFPGFVFQLLAENTVSGDPGHRQFHPGVATAGLLAILISFLLIPLEQGVCTLLVASSFTGDNPTLGACFRAAFRRLLGMLGLSFMLGAIVVLGFMLLVVPGVIFLTWYYVAVPALLVESVPAARAMERSKQLSEGHRLGIFGFMLLTNYLVVAIALTTNHYIDVAAGMGVTSSFLKYVVGAAIGAPAIVAPVAYYFNLRVKKEAFDVAALSSLVDLIARRATAEKGAIEG
jgi:hypothetical protein